MRVSLIAILFLIPAVVFAGGTSHDKLHNGNSWGSGSGDSPGVVTNPPVVITPVVVPPASPVNTEGSVTPAGGAGGGTQIYCSGPTSPGWHVDVVGGGCAPQNGTTTIIHLNVLPYTGISLWEWVLDTVAVIVVLFILGGLLLSILR